MLTTVDINDTLKEKLNKYASAKGMTMKAVINAALEEYLNKSTFKIFKSK